MAGAPRVWRSNALAQNPGDLWINLAIPAAAARMTLTAPATSIGLTPDATENPNAFHVGVTKGGSKLMGKSTMEKFFADEFRGPIASNVSELQMGISAELLAVTDVKLMSYMLPGVGTYATGSGYEEVRFGIKAITYFCAALLFPLVEDTTKYGVWQLYSSLNDAGVEFAVSRKEMGSTPISLVGYELTSRAGTDTAGIYWKNVVASYS